MAVKKIMKGDDEKKQKMWKTKKIDKNYTG